MTTAFVPPHRVQAPCAASTPFVSMRWTVSRRTASLSSPSDIARQSLQYRFGLAVRKKPEMRCMTRARDETTEVVDLRLTTLVAAALVCLPHAS